MTNQVNLVELSRLLGDRNRMAKEAETEINLLNTMLSPQPEKYYCSQDDWNAYSESVEKFWQDKEKRVDQYTAMKKEIDELDKQIIAAIPIKAVWFKLPELKIWIAKVSTSTMFPDGNDIRIYATDTPSNLPTLSTC